MPGSVLPSRNSSVAPPPVRHVRHRIGEAELVRCRGRVAAADDAGRAVIRDGLRRPLPCLRRKRSYS